MGRCKDCKCFIVRCLRGDRCKRCAREQEAAEWEEHKRSGQNISAETSGNVRASPSDENATVIVPGVETPVRLVGVSMREVEEKEMRYVKMQESNSLKSAGAQRKKDEANEYGESKKKAEEQKRAEFLREWSNTVDQILGDVKLEKKFSGGSLFGSRSITKVQSFTVSISDVPPGEYFSEPPQRVVVEAVPEEEEGGGTDVAAAPTEEASSLRSQCGSHGDSNGEVMVAAVATKDDPFEVRESNCASQSTGFVSTFDSFASVTSDAPGPSGLGVHQERQRLDTVVYLHKWGFDGESILEYLRATRSRAEKSASSETLKQVERSRYSHIEKLQRRRSIGYLKDWGFTPEQAAEYLRLTEPKERAASWKFSFTSYTN